MDYNQDGNLLGRFGAVVLIGLAAFGVHRVTCGGGMCPAMKTASCCSGESAPAATPAATPAAK